MLHSLLVSLLSAVQENPGLETFEVVSMNGCNVFSSLRQSDFHSLLLWLTYALYTVHVTSMDDIACHFIIFFLSVSVGWKQKSACCE